MRDKIVTHRYGECCVGTVVLVVVSDCNLLISACIRLQIPSNTRPDHRWTFYPNPLNALQHCAQRAIVVKLRRQ